MTRLENAICYLTLHRWKASVKTEVLYEFICIPMDRSCW